MGEKYCDDGPGLQVRPLFGEVPVARIANPIGEGFPAASLSTQLAGGPAGDAAVAEYQLRPSRTLADLVREATETVRVAGSGPDAVLGAVQTATGQLRDGLPVVRQQLAQGTATAQMLVAADPAARSKVGGALRDASRALRDTVTDDLTTFERFAGEALAVVEDVAKGAAETRLESTVNDYGQLAHRNAARVYDELLSDDAAGGAASGGTAA